MNPLIKKTVEKIAAHVNLTDSEKAVVAVEVGYAIMEAIVAAKENQQINVKGGDSIDENTVGNFEVSIYNTPMVDWNDLHQKN